MINWLCAQGEDILAKHDGIADDLESIETQRQEFEKIYLSAMVKSSYALGKLYLSSLVASLLDNVPFS